MTKLADLYRQAHKEAILALALAGLYFIWWYATAYGFAPDEQDTQLPTLVMGFPVWFFLSCVVGPVLFCGLCYLMVKMFYKDIPLDPTEEENNDEQ
ncbi:YhdT family protein [Vibrio zhugei]|uniref:YhdT family protein n=1 Tax=Vibrio zhugei TaxID=2479546 RepID=A0ABV7C9Y0_9VIBR|nr:YhdT family protein [Vibrio zhugei]